jgi:hypothetical protein
VGAGWQLLADLRRCREGRCVRCHRELSVLRVGVAGIYGERRGGQSHDQQQSHQNRDGPPLLVAVEALQENSHRYTALPLTVKLDEGSTSANSTATAPRWLCRRRAR